MDKLAHAVFSERRKQASDMPQQKYKNKKSYDC